MLQTKSVSPELLSILSNLMDIEELFPFRLVGGTALAIQFGHRLSIDIDLFTDKSFDKQEILNAIFKFYKPEEISITANGITCFINDVKIDICNWSVPFIGSIVKVDNIRMSSPEDIAAFKLDAIANRKEKKDFYDLYFLLERTDFNSMLLTYKKKYPYNNLKNIFLGISEIALANDSIHPVLMKNLDWKLIISKLTKTAENYLAENQNEKLRNIELRNAELDILVEKRKANKRKLL